MDAETDHVLDERLTAAGASWRVSVADRSFDLGSWLRPGSQAAPRPERRGRRLLATAGALVVVALVAAGGALLATDSGHSSTAPGAAGSSSTTSSPVVQSPSLIVGSWRLTAYTYTTAGSGEVTRTLRSGPATQFTTSTVESLPDTCPNFAGTIAIKGDQLSAKVTLGHELCLPVISVGQSLEGTSTWHVDGDTLTVVSRQGSEMIFTRVSPNGTPGSS